MSAVCSQLDRANRPHPKSERHYTGALSLYTYIDIIDGYHAIMISLISRCKGIGTNQWKLGEKAIWDKVEWTDKLLAFH